MNYIKHKDAAFQKEPLDEAFFKKEPLFLHNVYYKFLEPKMHITEVFEHCHSSKQFATG